LARIVLVKSQTLRLSLLLLQLGDQTVKPLPNLKFSELLTFEEFTGVASLIDLVHKWQSP
jgi:hypothetical protein